MSQKLSKHQYDPLPGEAVMLAGNSVTATRETAMSRPLRVFFCIALFCALPVYGAALVESTSGDVRAGSSAAQSAEVGKGQRVEAGSVVVTGAKSTAVLRFDDGQAVALNESTEFRVTDFSYAKDEPAKDRSVFELVKGAVRSLTGLIAQRTPEAYELRIPQGTIGIRGTDFMVASVNPAYAGVLNGTIAISNSAGVQTFSAGTYATVPSATSLATAIPASALPPSVATSFSQLSSMSLAAGAASAGGEASAESASGAAAGGVTVGVVSAIAAAIGVAAAISSSQDSSSGTTGTTGTTGTHQ